jgi:cellulose synthase/poly-beta-1,6-N-acetylglucosamine synthase-like glycosyltransferase
MVSRRVVALIPAHNEEDLIEKTILSLVNQSYPLDIIVVSDNSTDQTVQIVKAFHSKYSQLSLMETKDNHFKKAGALNQAIARLSQEYDYVLCADADTVLDQDLIQEAVRELDSDETLGAVCSRAGILDPPEGISWKEKLLWHLQHIEYAGFDTSRIETLGGIKVAHGMASVYRLSAMLDVMRYREEKFGVKDQVYDETNIVEDYELTICLKELDYKITVNMRMLAWTEVPLNVNALWKQRLRWVRGGIDVIRNHGFNTVTANEYFQNLLFIIVTALQAIIAVYIIIAMIHGSTLSLGLLTYIIIFLIYFDGLYRIRYVQNLKAFDVALKLVFVADLLYCNFYIIVQIYSYYLSFMNKKQTW